MIFRKLVFLTLLYGGLSPVIRAQPTVTVRFANPDYDFSTQTYCLDAEFQSDSEEVILFGMNVRFWYDDNILEYLSMGEFIDGYAQSSPNPPLTFTGTDTLGSELFGFDGPAEYINGGIVWVNSSDTIHLSTTGWTKLFNICFHVDDSTAGYSDNFSPSVIWDIEQDHTNGGFLTGSQGMVITVAAPPPYQSGPANENAIHFNWVYDDPPDPPYGYPVSMNGISTRVAPLIQIDSTLAFADEYKTFSVRAWHFFDISSMSLTLDYDPVVLNYCCCVPSGEITPDFISSLMYPGRLQFTASNLETDFGSGSTIFSVIFKYNGSASTLTWYDDGPSCQFVNSYTGLILYDTPRASFYKDGYVTTGEFIWSGGYSSDWNNKSNWQYGIIPGPFDDATVNSSPLPANWPAYNGHFTLGDQSRNLTLNGTSSLSISGNLAIKPGHVLDIENAGLVQIGGDWTNSGTFNPGTGTIVFTSALPGHIKSGPNPRNYTAAYGLSVFPRGMVGLSGGFSGPSGDNAHVDINLGFIFNYLGIGYSQVRINTNGWLSFILTGDNASSADNLRLYENSSPAAAVAPWWDDLLADGSSSVTYKTEGTAPDRIFTSEWKNILAFQSGSSARLNFQVKLLESSNIIEFHYGDVLAGTHNTAEGASVGIKDLEGGPGNFKEAAIGTSHLMIGCLRSDLHWPAVNYRFTPPEENNAEVFHKISVTLSSPLNVERNVIITGTE